MEFELPIHHLMGFLMALVRTTAWMAIAPPFNSRGIPRLAKLGIAAAISLSLAPKMPIENVTFETGPLLVQVLTQTATGLILGFLTYLVFAAIQAAGQIIDILGGFTLSTAFDPMLNAQSSVFGRFYALLATTLLFASNGHLMMIRGFMTSFNAVPLTGPDLGNLESILLNVVGNLMISAVEIAGPLVAAMFLTEIALGLLTKAAPQLNVIMFGFPLKVFLTVSLVGSILTLLPNAVDNLLTRLLQFGVPLIGGA